MATKRRAKSSIKRLPAEQRAEIERLLRADDKSLNEMIEHLKAKFPGEPAAEVSRSALHRFGAQFAEMTGRMREIQTMGETLAGELGEGIGDKAGELLSQAVITLATRSALDAHGKDDISIDEIRKLAVAAKNAIDSRRMDVNVRKAIRDEARAAVLAEQKEKIEALGKSGAIDPAVLKQVIRAAYDL
ncbi:MAG: DUF3486 family protein [Luteimonas sp.]|nr:DUF3486 family protein [Luteimonas sp.]